MNHWMMEWGTMRYHEVPPCFQTRHVEFMNVGVLDKWIRVWVLTHPNISHEVTPVGDIPMILAIMWGIRHQNSPLNPHSHSHPIIPVLYNLSWISYWIHVGLTNSLNPSKSHLICPKHMPIEEGFVIFVQLEVAHFQTNVAMGIYGTNPLHLRHFSPNCQR